MSYIIAMSYSITQDISNRDSNGQTQVQQIVQSIEDRILKENFSHGDFFATEEQLCQEFNVSRSLIRDAVGHLKGLGILKSIKKVGLVVNEIDPMELFETGLKFYTSSKLNVHNLFEIRFILELGALENAIRKATDEQIQELESLANEFERMAIARESAEKTIQIDMKFHEMILIASGNILLQRIHTIISNYYFRYHLKLVQEWENNHIRSTELLNPINVKNIPRQIQIGLLQHQEIVHAFKTRDFELGKFTLMVHLRRSLEQVSKNINNSEKTNQSIN